MSGRIIALDKRGINPGVVAVRMEGKKPLIDQLYAHTGSGSEITHVLWHARKELHTHPSIYSVLFGVLDPAILKETMDKKTIFDAVEGKKGREIPIVAWQYNLGANVNRGELDALNTGCDVLLINTGFHMGIVNSSLYEKIKQRAKPGTLGEFKEDGKITEQYVLLAISILEEQVGDRGVDALLNYVQARIMEGSTIIEDKLVFTECEWEIIKQAIPKLRERYGYSPLTAVYVDYNLFKMDPRKYVDEAVRLGIDFGVKWVGDGGTTSQNAALEYYSFPGGNKGELCIPINYQDPREVQTYLRLLQENGVTKMAFHAIGDRTIGIALDLFPRLQEVGVIMSIEHFEIPTPNQIQLAAQLGVPLHMQGVFSSERIRFPDVEVLEFNNPLASVLGAYSRQFRTDLLDMSSTDGMPEGPFFSAAVGAGNPVTRERVNLEIVLGLSQDPMGMVLMTMAGYNRMLELQTREGMAEAVKDLQGSANAVHKEIVMVIRDGKTLYTRE